MLFVRLVMRLWSRERAKRSTAGAVLLWLAASCGLNYAGVRFHINRVGNNPGYFEYPAPGWLTPLGLAAAAIGGVVLAWAAIWPLPSAEDHSPAPGPAGSWKVALVLLGIFDGVALATAVTAPDKGGVGDVLLVAAIITLMTTVGRRLWMPDDATESPTPEDM